MISERVAKEIDELFEDETVTRETIKAHVINIVSELEEEITILAEKVENLEYHLGLTGVKGKE